MQDEKFDLTLTGLQSDDQGFAQVGVILAEKLGLPHATIIMEVAGRGRRRLRVKRELEGGWFQWVAMPLPAVLTIQSGINQLRYATLKGIMAAKKKEIKKAAVPGGARRQAEDRRLYVPEKGKKTQLIAGIAGRSGQGARPQAARRSAGDRMILVIAEQSGGKLNRASWETIVGAQQLAGIDRRRRYRRAGRRRQRRLVRVPNWPPRRSRKSSPSRTRRSRPYTPDGFTAALQDAIGQLVAVARAAAAHLSDARLRAEARGAARSRAADRRHRHQDRRVPKPRSRGRCFRAS